MMQVPIYCKCSGHIGVALKAAPDEQILGQLRDWNEELQSSRELPTDTTAHKLFRDRSLFKVILKLVTWLVEVWPTPMCLSPRFTVSLCKQRSREQWRWWMGTSLL